jgi:hypothetical protein
MLISEIINGKSISMEIERILSYIHINGPIDPSDFELLAYMKKYKRNEFKNYESKLLFLMGLFYKKLKPQSLLEESYTIIADSIQDEVGVILTPIQANAYKNIFNNKYFSFSAPTSSGKSFLFRELIHKYDKDIIIVVPSRALIAEYMELVKGIVSKDVLVLQFIDNINIQKSRRRIFIITPERGIDLFKYMNDFSVSLILFDEAQLSEDEIRGMRFDAFVRRVDICFPKTKKVFAHPFIENPEAQLAKHHFTNNAIYKKYNQIAVGKICVAIDESKRMYYFSPFIDPNKREYIEVGKDIIKDILSKNGTLLIYISKSDIYDGSFWDDFAGYIELCHVITNPDAILLIEKLRKYIGASSRGEEKHSTMIELMRRGIVFHHGSIPLKARLLVEEFINRNYAKICFATSTLTQGINMPFDIVLINNFRFMGNEESKKLELKNLIGRAGRSVNTNSSFDYGYIVLKKRNVETFCERINDKISISEKSRLDDNIKDIDEDDLDIVNALKENSFDDILNLTNEQVNRLKTDLVENDIENIIEYFIKDGKPITGNDYYNLSNTTRNTIKESLKNIFICHLRRKEFTIAEKSILSAAIPIMLWRIQGKSFAEIVSLRYSYLSRRDERRKIVVKFRKGEIDANQMNKQLHELYIHFTPPGIQLPNRNARRNSLFPINTSVINLEYDMLVYDTYDYLDKTISLSLMDPITAAFSIYYEKKGDLRAKIMYNYIKYGTNNESEIMLLRYGFEFEEIKLIQKYIERINENGIYFKKSIKRSSQEIKNMVKRYL